MNKNLLSKILSFASDDCVGSIVTWKLIEKKYQQIAQEEIDSVKEALGYVNQRADKPETEEDDEDTKEDVGAARKEIERIVREQGYDYNAVSKKEGNDEKEEEESMNEKPYVISPEEFGDCDYKTVSLTYYNDDVLTYENGEVIHNIDELVGEGSLDTFGQYEADSVFVRNDDLKTDFEILADERNYYEMFMGD